MSKNNLIIIISAVLILILSVGGYFVFNSQSSNKTEKISNSNSGNSPAQLTKNNETNDIKINENGTINPKFQSSETK